MLYRQVFKSLAGVQKRAAFERAHASDRGNVNYRFYIVRCRGGKPDILPFDRGVKYDYRIEKSLKDYPSDPRLLAQLED